MSERRDALGEIARRYGVGRVDLILLNEADPFLAAEIIRGERRTRSIPPSEINTGTEIRGHINHPYKIDRRCIINL